MLSKKFERSSPFSILAADWPTAVRDDFAEFVLAVHDSGLDLWIIADGQIRLGNKSGTRDRAEACLAWIIAQKNGPIISFSRLVAGADTLGGSRKTRAGAFASARLFEDISN